jgi:hypothetical protein
MIGLKSNRPYVETNPLEYLRKRVLQLRHIAQAAIVTEAGFANVNMLSMIKNGTIKLPLAERNMHPV